MNDRPHQVIGVLPDVPQYPREVDVYMPTSACPFRSDRRTTESRDARMMQAFARLRPGVTLEKAHADLDIVAAGLQARYPEVLPPGRRLPRRGHSPPAGADPFVPPDPAGAAGHRGLRPADRLRQRRQPDGRAHGAARARDLDPVGARRDPRPPAPAAPHREHAAGARRRGHRPAARRLGRRSPRDVRGAVHRRAPTRSASTAPSCSTPSRCRSPPAWSLARCRR